MKCQSPTVVSTEVTAKAMKILHNVSHNSDPPNDVSLKLYWSFGKY